jgi:hypothetical protein
VTNTVSISGFLTPFDYEAVVVSTAAVGLTAAKYNATASLAAAEQGKARLVMLTVEGRVRFRFDGVSPTGTEGHILNDGDVLYLNSIAQISQFKAIRNSTEVSDATLRVTYLR